MDEGLFSFDPLKEKKNALLAIPKKGRLYEKCMKLLDGAGLDHHRPNRLDVAHCSGLPITIVFLPASDIATCKCSKISIQNSLTVSNSYSFSFASFVLDVGEGNVDVGITGLDVVEESNVDVNHVLVSTDAFHFIRRLYLQFVPL
jgi:ATP phosphoribosyltransferase